jgi:hypothetical protein
MQPGAAMDLRIDRARSAAAAPAHWSTPTTPGPPRLALRGRAEGLRTAGRGSCSPHFNRRRWSSFHPAPTRRGVLCSPDARVPRLRTFLRPSSEDATDRMERASPIRLRQLLADRAQLDLRAARIEESVLIAIVPLTMEARVRDLEAKYLGE